MTSLVLELQSAAMDPEKSVDDLLRMAIVVSSKLRLDEFKQWCERELHGYGKEAVPAYRRVQGQLRARNPFHGWVPVIVSDPDLMEQLSHRDVGQPISELAYLLSQKVDGGTLQIPLPHHILMEVFGGTREFQLGMMPTLLVGSSEVHGILSAVRDKILGWSLQLEQQGVLGSGMTFSREEVHRASQITYNIGRFSGVLGDVSGSTIQVGDYSSIHRELKQAGIPQEQRNELERVLEELRTAPLEQKRSLARQGLDWVVRNGSAIGALSDTIRGWFEPFLR